MTNKIFEGIRKIATQLGMSAPQSNDGIYIEHLLNQLNSRVGSLNEDLGQAILDNAEYEKRINALNLTLDTALAPYLERASSPLSRHQKPSTHLSNTN